MSVPFDCGEEVIDCPYLPKICEVISMLDFWCYRQKCLWQIEMSSLTESESTNLLIFDVFYCFYFPLLSCARATK